MDTQTIECEWVGIAKGDGTERPGVCAAGSERVRELTLRSGPQAGRGSQAGWLSGPPRIKTRPVLISYGRKRLSGDFLATGMRVHLFPLECGEGPGLGRGSCPL